MRTLREENFSLLRSYIEQYADERGVSPSIYDIAEGTGIPKTTVSRYLSAMEERGLLRRESRRGLVLADGEDGGIRVPLLGTIACGIPKLAEENIESYMRLPAALFGKGPFFMLRAWGDSMVNAGIEDGDLVLIRQQSTARPGQIVVALTGEEATLKRYYPEPLQHRIRLQPENDAMEPIYVRDCIIQGVAVRVMKELD
ncbi:MAG: transcriptional repressor LexA [Oscillospiraceae bacterium]|nr:transcriptional repressor LexA [Oscillospiraceae bacterium]